jgi:hypothetical protein
MAHMVMNGDDVMSRNDDGRRSACSLWADEHLEGRTIRVIGKSEIFRQRFIKPSCTNVLGHVSGWSAATIFPGEGEPHASIKSVGVGRSEPSNIKRRDENEGPLDVQQGISRGLVRLPRSFESFPHFAKHPVVDASVDSGSKEGEKCNNRKNHLHGEVAFIAGSLLMLCCFWYLELRIENLRPPPLLMLLLAFSFLQVAYGTNLLLDSQKPRAEAAQFSEHFLAQHKNVPAEIVHKTLLSLDRRLAQSVALRFGFQYGILALLCLPPDAISHPAGRSLSLLAPIVARSSLIVTASAATSLRFYGSFGGRWAFCWSAGF